MFESWTHNNADDEDNDDDDDDDDDDDNNDDGGVGVGGDDDDDGFYIETRPWLARTAAAHLCDDQCYSVSGFPSRPPLSGSLRGPIAFDKQIAMNLEVRVNRSPFTGLCGSVPFPVMLQPLHLHLFLRQTRSGLIGNSSLSGYFFIEDRPMGSYMYLSYIVNTMAVDDLATHMSMSQSISSNGIDLLILDHWGLDSRWFKAH